MRWLRDAVWIPFSKQPELKHAAVKILKAELPWRAGRDPALRRQAAALACCKRSVRCMALSLCAGHTCTAAGSPLVVFRAAAASRHDEALLADIDGLFGLAGDEGAAATPTPNAGQQRTAIGRDGRLLGVRLAGEARPKPGSRGAGQDELPAPGLRPLAPGARRQAAGDGGARGNIVCSCSDVSDGRSSEALAARGHDCRIAG